MSDLKMKYGYNDISIVPARISCINHRSEVNPYYSNNNKLPIFTAPMSSIITQKSIDNYSKINIVIPRSFSLEHRIQLSYIIFCSFSMSEIEDIIKKLPWNQCSKVYICIDVANGHMEKLYDLVRAFKYFYPNSVVMTGNIANPETLKMVIESGVNYIRVGIGSGLGCITSSNTAIHYPMASLVKECSMYLDDYKWNVKRTNLKIIADGGIRNYNDVIKALALGADYVMIGGLFAKCMNSNEDLYIKSDGNYVRANKEDLQKSDIQLYHKFYGMASKEGMNDLHLEKHTAEGICKYIPIKYDSINQWSKNMADYLRSAMSYCNAKTLDEFIGKQKYILLSDNAQNAINK